MGGCGGEETDGGDGDGPDGEDHVVGCDGGSWTDGLGCEEVAA